jgi:hypothetical protein
VRPGRGVSAGTRWLFAVRPDQGRGACTRVHFTVPPDQSLSACTRVHFTVRPDQSLSACTSVHFIVRPVQSLSACTTVHFTVRPVQSLSACTRVHFTVYLTFTMAQIARLLCQHRGPGSIPGQCEICGWQSGTVTVKCHHCSIIVFIFKTTFTRRTNGWNLETFQKAKFIRRAAGALTGIALGHLV